MPAVRLLAKRAFAGAGALALASGLAGAAAAQAKVDTIGDWDRVSIQHVMFLVAATPNTRAARAFCAAVTIHGSDPERRNLDAEAERIGASKDYGCIRLGCKPQGHRGDFELTIFANAPPLADGSRLAGGVSLRMRSAPGEVPVVLFDRASQRQISRDGELELLVWGVRPPQPGADGERVPAMVSLAASTAFLDRLAARQTVEFELSPWDNTMGPRSPHGGRTVAFSLAGMADAMADLRRHCDSRPNR